MPDVKKIEDKKLSDDQFKKIAEYISDEYTTRKRKRGDKEKKWKEIDRQLEMEPACRHKRDSQGRLDKNKSWMPEIELPLQAETLEILTSDARRMTFPDTGSWFTANAKVSKEYLESMEMETLISGETDQPSIIKQDNIDKIVIGAIETWHRQYDFRGNIDLINAESFKYGDGVGRLRNVKKSMFIDTASGIADMDKKFPVFFPRSIKNTYLDDSEHSLQNEGYMIGPSVIFEQTIKLSGLKVAASNGDNNPMDENGGWMSKRLEGLEPDKNDQVKFFEYEGDLIVPDSGADTMYLPKVIITVLRDSSKNGGNRIVRLRFKKSSLNSYIVFPYHREHIDQRYASSPLMKGRPLQMAAVESITQYLMVAALHAQPPMKYDPDDEYYAGSAPSLFPGCRIPSTGGLDLLKVGEPQAMMNAYLALVSQYHGASSVQPSRLGEQTKSHTTARSKDLEIARGTVRTVDYVKSSLEGPLTKLLYMEWEMGLREWNNEDIYLPQPYGGYVSISKEMLPEVVTFFAHGAGGPLEEQEKVTSRLQALQVALQIDKIKAEYQAQGIQSSIDLDAAIEQVLREGRWNDVDAILTSNKPIANIGAVSGVAGNTEINQPPQIGGTLSAQPA